MVKGSAAIQLHPGPIFEATKGHFSHLGVPDPPLRFGFIGVSGSGKGVAMLDLLLRHYRGTFESASTSTAPAPPSTRDGML